MLELLLPEHFQRLGLGYLLQQDANAIEQAQRIRANNAITQADRNRAKSVAASEKADREKRMREKKEQVAAAKAAREAAKAAAKLPPSGKAEKELMKIVKRGDEAQDAGDFEAALEAFHEAMAGFVKLGAKRPKLAEKIADIERWVEEEATC